MSDDIGASEKNLPDSDIAEQEAFVRVARSLHALLPPGATSVSCSTSRTVALGSRQIIAVMEDGSEQSIRGNRELSDATGELRRSMYRDGAGTWFSARFTVTAEGKADGAYNYDHEPDWDFPPDPQIYAADLEAFPRDDGHMPEWLRQKVRERETRRTRHAMGEHS